MKLPKLPRDFPTLKLRYVRRRPLPYSQREELVLQQWWWHGRRGSWQDVPIENEKFSHMDYDLPDGRTK